MLENITGEVVIINSIFIIVTGISEVIGIIYDILFLKIIGIIGLIWVSLLCIVFFIYELKRGKMKDKFGEIWGR